jgi:hypothetical protein
MDVTFLGRCVPDRCVLTLNRPHQGTCQDKSFWVVLGGPLASVLWINDDISISHRLSFYPPIKHPVTERLVTKRPVTGRPVTARPVSDRPDYQTSKLPNVQITWTFGNLDLW